MLTSPTEINGRVSNMLYTTNPPLSYVMGTTPVIGKKAYPTKWNKGLAPRIGIAWDPFGQGKTSVQAGYGIFYDQIESEYRFFTHINPPFAPRAQTSAPGAFPIPWSVVDVGALQTVGRSIDPNLDVPTVHHFNFGVEQQVGSAAMVRVGYVGSRGSDLLSVVESNIRVPQLVNGELFWPTTAPLANPLLGQWDVLLSDASNSYDALQTELQTRFGGKGPLGRLRSKVGYTFSKSMDNMSGLQSSAASNTRGKHLDPLNLDRDRGLSAYHMAHQLTLNFTYDLQGLPLKGVSGALFNNWQVSGIWTAASGLPINLQNAVRRSRNGQNTNVERPNLIAGGNNNPVLGGHERYFDPSQFQLPPAGFLGNLGRNTLIGPGLFNVRPVALASHPGDRDLRRLQCSGKAGDFQRVQPRQLRAPRHRDLQCERHRAWLGGPDYPDGDTRSPDAAWREDRFLVDGGSTTPAGGRLRGRLGEAHAGRGSGRMAADDGLNRRHGNWCCGTSCRRDLSCRSVRQSVSRSYTARASW